MTEVPRRNNRTRVFYSVSPLLLAGRLSSLAESRLFPLSGKLGPAKHSAPAEASRVQLAPRPPPPANPQRPSPRFLELSTRVFDKTNATKDAKKALRKYSDELFEGKSELTKTWRQFLDEGAKIAERIGTASMVLLLMAFAFGVLVGAGISRFSWQTSRERATCGRASQAPFHCASAPCLITPSA